MTDEQKKELISYLAWRGSNEQQRQQLARSSPEWSYVPSQDGMREREFDKLIDGLVRMEMLTKGGIQ